MKIILEWLKPGVRVKRYILLQLLSVAALIYAIVTLCLRENLALRTMLAYIALITIALFTTIFSFVLAQRKVLMTTLKAMAYKGENVEVRKLLYTDSILRKGAKIVMIGGGKGLANILHGLKEYTSNITSIVATFDDGGSTGKLVEELGMLPPGDVRKSIIALSSSESSMEKLLSYRFSNGKVDNHSLGNLFLAALTDIMGGFAPAIQKMSEIFNVRGQILPITLGKAKLCAGLENGEIIVGEDNIRPRVIESKSKIKQIFLKETEGKIELTPGILSALKNADAIVIGPGSLYTSIACNMLVDEMGKAIISSKAKKIFISNLMNEPGETTGYTLAKHINEIERYIGKHVLDYCITNNGEITRDMIKDFNQGNSTPVIVDLDNIQNRTISIIEEDLVVTAPNSIIHNSLRVSEIIIELAKRKSIGDLNLLKLKEKHKLNAKKVDKKTTTVYMLRDKVKSILAENMLKRKEIQKAKEKNKNKEKSPVQKSQEQKDAEKTAKQVIKNMSKK